MGWEGSFACRRRWHFLYTRQLKQDIDDPLSGLGCLREAPSLPDKPLCQPSAP